MCSLVTGVQTCALPICNDRRRARDAAARGPSAACADGEPGALLADRAGGGAGLRLPAAQHAAAFRGRHGGGLPARPALRPPAALGAVAHRTEERRVGEGGVRRCWYGWAPVY